MDFTSRRQKLNKNQLEAVEKIHGPLLVVAGPGTGKTELLSMRVAEILQQTDTLASNILCLTFTESGANNMRERLRQIIGEDAYKVAIHTFHSFGVEIINQNGEYFFEGSDFQPADDLTQYQILKNIFENLDWQHPLASKNHDEFVYLKTVSDIIPEFKKSGLSVEELRQVIDSNQQTIDQLSTDIAEVFADRISQKTIENFALLAKKVAEISSPPLPPNITPYANVLALSIAHASQEAIESNSTKPVTAWKNKWCKKDINKQTVLKDALETEKLRATIDIYEQYEADMAEARVYDYDDMILRVNTAVEKHPDLKANLQERFQFVMVDEFQDTNLAQLRLLFNICPDDQPNIMAVGDDDQAIFSFQGADVGNIQRFREHFNNPPIVVLIDNYRSTPNILAGARKVITQGEDRLENTIADLSKELTPHVSASDEINIQQFSSPNEERTKVACQIKKLIKAGTKPEDIAVIARQHNELINILPYFAREGILVNYERRDDALEHELVKLIELLARTIVSIKRGEHDTANALLPELVAHPAFGFSALDIWKISLEAWRKRSLWLEVMQTSSIFSSFAKWLIERSILIDQKPLEEQIDILIGVSQPTETKKEPDIYRSPILDYFFSDEKLAETPDAYLDVLEALRTIRNQLREHFVNNNPTLEQLIEFIDLYRQLGAGLAVVRYRANHQSSHVNLMTAHKAKGLEFDKVFIVGAIDETWGEKASFRSRSISYPMNLPLKPTGDNYDERLRLFFVAMTRAKQSLNISFSSVNSAGKDTLIASFLSSAPNIAESVPTDSIDDLVGSAETDWRDRLTRPISGDLKSVLTPILENYKLSVTHLNNFLDVSNGGPQAFLMNNLLNFPQAKSPNASFGTAMHDTLQQLHDKRITDQTTIDVAQSLDLFSKNLARQHLSADDYAKFNDRGRQVLEKFLEQKADSMTDNQITELNFVGQGVTIGEAKLTGKLDLADIDKKNKTILVTDYKTGKPATSWKGKTDYEKIKLHKYRQQLMFYQLLIENSRDFSGYEFRGGVLQFVEPDQQTGEVLALEDTFSREELADFSRLVKIIWQKIINLDLPDVSEYSRNYKGMLQFEQDLLET